MNLQTPKIFGYRPSLIELAIGSLILIIVFFWVYKKINVLIAQARENRKYRDLENQIIKGELTYDAQTYKNFADRLVNAMDDQLSPGTDESAIYNIFKKLENKSDLLELVKVFGKRDKHPFLGFGSQSLNLGGWLADELNNDELATVNKIIAEKGINIEF